MSDDLKKTHVTIYYLYVDLLLIHPPHRVNFLIYKVCLKGKQIFFKNKFIDLPTTK